MPELTLQQAFELALEQHQAGRLADAESIYRQILAVEPDQPETLHMLGVLAGQAGNPNAAIELIRHALMRRPAWPEALNNLGEVLRLGGQAEAAIATLKNAIAIAPEYVVAYGNLSFALNHAERWDEAITICRQGLVIHPYDGKLSKNLAYALVQTGLLDEAIAVYRTALARQPGEVELHNSLGVALSQAGQADEAVAMFRQAMALQPNFVMAYNNCGVALSVLGKWEDAVETFRQAIALQPDYPEAYYNLGKAFEKNDQLDEAIAAYQQAIALKPGYAEAYDNLGVAFKGKGQLDDALAAHRQACILQPRNSEFHRNVLFTLHYHPASDPAAIAAEHRSWAREHAEPLRCLIQPHANDRTPERRLRIGYVSPDFREHAVARLLLPLLEHHDRKIFEIFAYAQVAMPDRVTERMKGLTDVWRNTVGLTDQQVADLIRRDHIDLLVDLAGHTANNRLLVFAQKPAPVQVTCLGYPDTTGLTTIDYRLTDALADPPGKTESWHSEKLIRIPESAWCIELAESPAPAARGAGPLTFGCFNNMAKVTEPMLRLWAQILAQVPDSRLLLKSSGMGSVASRERVEKILGELGIEANRLDLRRPDQAYDGHLAQYHDMDIALDPFPYHGTVSTCEALWMGVPVVTLAGQSHVSRVGVSLLTNVGLPELIAETPEAYVQIAVSLANARARLQELRSTLRERMQASPLMDAARYTRSIETAYRQMWRTWCQNCGDLQT